MRQSLPRRWVREGAGIIADEERRGEFQQVAGRWPAYREEQGL
jgi:hypothetical protein